MGLLVQGKPLTWQQTKKLQQYIKYHGLLQFINLWRSLKSKQCDHLYWGDEIECLLLTINPNDSTISLKLRAADILEDLQKRQDDHESNREGSSWNVIFHPEYGNFMLEVTPNVPYGNTTRDLRLVETNHRLRRALLQAALNENEIVLFLSNFPFFGHGTFTTPAFSPRGTILKSSYVPDQVMSPHPRFATLSGNIRRRRGRRVNITMPLFKDRLTKDDASGNILPEDEIESLRPSNDVIHMDAMGFGMGQCCLQVTFQARSIDEARFLYDQLAVISPIFLALTANTPFHRGRVADTDARWNVISQAVDDRTYTEMGISKEEQEKQLQGVIPATPPSPEFKPDEIPLITKEDGSPFDDSELTPLDDLNQQYTENGVYNDIIDTQPTVGIPYEHGETPRIFKSRYSSIDCYISSDNPHYKPEYNDVPFPYDRVMYALLRKEGVDELLAKHIASLFIRDSLVTFEGQIELDDHASANHFESIQSSNWRSVRFKPPPIDSDIGWRVEFRTMELQMTDFENAAFTVFLALLTRAITYFHLNFYMPLSLVDENFEIAHRNDAVRKDQFHFKGCIPFDNKPCPKRQRLQREAGCQQWEKSEEITSRPCRHQQEQGSGEQLPSAQQQHSHEEEGSTSTSCEYVKMSIAEIMCGTDVVAKRFGEEATSGRFIGLISIVKHYLTRIHCDEETLNVVNRYLLLVEKRALGELLTGAQWMRNFLYNHPSYQHDSIIPHDALYDLCIFTNALGNIHAVSPDLTGHLDPSVDYDDVMTGETPDPSSLPRSQTTSGDVLSTCDILSSYESSNIEKLRKIVQNEVVRIQSSSQEEDDYYCTKECNSPIISHQQSHQSQGSHNTPQQQQQQQQQQHTSTYTSLLLPNNTNATLSNISQLSIGASQHELTSLASQCVCATPSIDDNSCDAFNSPPAGTLPPPSEHGGAPPLSLSAAQLRRSNSHRLLCNKHTKHEPHAFTKQDGKNQLDDPVGTPMQNSSTPTTN